MTQNGSAVLRGLSPADVPEYLLWVFDLRLAPQVLSNYVCEVCFTHGPWRLYLADADRVYCGRCFTQETGCRPPD